MRILGEGTRVANRYTLIRQLGVGGSAEVWLAEDSRIDSQVALKFLTREFAASPQHALLLKREWRIGSRLMHANIVRFFEFHDDADGAFYGLQYVGLTDIGVLTGAHPAESLRPVGLVADALRYAHGKGVVHRDIKASNILLDSRGFPYLTDFGVAADAGDTVDIVGGGSTISRSPQQLAGKPPAAKDDIFALGILIHELLTGLPPLDGEFGKLKASGEPIPGALQDLLNSMLDSDAQRRPEAESITGSLLAAGVSTGPAPAGFVAGEAGINEAIQSSASGRPQRQDYNARPEPVAQSGKSSGISPTALYGGLAVALVLFLAVIFVLPNLAGQDATPIATERELTGAPGLSDAERPVEAGEDDSVNAESSTPSDSQTLFNENVNNDGPTTAAQRKAATDSALGDLLSQLERLQYRAIDRWGGQEYLDAVDVYAEGDQAYVDRNYRLAGQKYRRASELLEPFLDRIDAVFEATLAAAQAAFDASDYSESIRLFDLATSITPGHREAEAGFARARSLQAVLTLMTQGEQFEEDLELAAAKLAFEKALELDALWEPASVALGRVKIAIRQLSFEQRMTEGFDALFASDFATAKAAFNAAKALDPSSRQPADGLLQVDQEIRLAAIRRLEREAASLDAAEQWEASLVVYEDILKIDPDLQFAQTGLSRARSRLALHVRLTDLIAEPDTLSDPANIRNATSLLLEVTKIHPTGPRIEDQKNELSRLLKRAATPVPVQVVSDNLTNVVIFKVGQFGTFARKNLNLRPGKYVAVGNRAGYRDVRVEFRVAPEVEMKPIVVRCEESI